jgi:hypothetical protein
MEVGVAVARFHPQPRQKVVSPVAQRRDGSTTGRNWSNIESYMDRYYKDKVSKTKRKKMSPTKDH